MVRRHMVRSGLDILVDESFARCRGKRIGVLANQSAVDAQCRHILPLLQQQSALEVVRLFAPEHGFSGTKQDMELVEDGARASTLEVVSLYGLTEKDLHPQAEALRDLDLLLVDLPDIGARYYTFAQTMAYCMAVAAQTGTKVLVLDRPNPINGINIEGTTVLDTCRSFCGYGPLPQRHGLTLGELALVYNAGMSILGQQIPAINCDLEVVHCTGWERAMYFDQCGLPWVIPSVNMPTLDTAIVYPGMCLFEATALSEGRGTTKPFEFVGAPYIDGAEWSTATLQQGLPLDGALLRPIEFIPKFHKHKEETCGGVQIHVIDREEFQPLRWALALLSAAKQLYPNDFAWRSGSYEFIDSVAAIDLLYGSSNLRETMERGETLEAIELEINEFSAAFSAARSEFLLY